MLAHCFTLHLCYICSSNIWTHCLHLYLLCSLKHTKYIIFIKHVYSGGGGASDSGGGAGASGSCGGAGASDSGGGGAGSTVVVRRWWCRNWQWWWSCDLFLSTSNGAGSGEDDTEVLYSFINGCYFVC
ncbi:hypothetical protein Hanom_Chr10g00915801 [Helianthus anomalus]